MEPKLAYLHESLSDWRGNYVLARSLHTKLESNVYQNEEAFISDLSMDESLFLSDILQREMAHARGLKDDFRVEALNNIHGRLI